MKSLNGRNLHDSLGERRNGNWHEQRERFSSVWHPSSTVARCAVVRRWVKLSGKEDWGEASASDFHGDRAGGRDRRRFRGGGELDSSARGRAQIGAFEALVQGNNRPVQPLNDRTVVTDRVGGES